MSKPTPKHFADADEEQKATTTRQVFQYARKYLAVIAITCAGFLAVGTALPANGGLWGAQPASAADQPSISWGGGTSVHPGDGAPLFMQGFDWSQPITVSMFGVTKTINYLPWAPYAWYSPPHAPIGTHKITAKQGSRYAEHYVYLGDFNPWTQVSQYYVQPGQHIIFWAQQFKSGEEVHLLADGKPTGVAGRAGTNVLYYHTQGKVNLTYTPPRNWAGKTVHFQLMGQSSRKSADAWITIAH